MKLKLALLAGPFVLMACSTSAPAVKPAEPAQSQSAGSTWVSQPDGSLSCGGKPKVTLAEAGKKLEAAGIRVLQSWSGGDGRIHAMVCGIASGNVNALKIASQDVPKAEALGFRPASADVVKRIEAQKP